MKHPNQHLYPIIDDEFGTRFFDPELVAVIIAEDHEFFADPLMKPYIREGDKPMEWDSMSLLAQIKVQIGFVAPPPRSAESIEGELAAEDRWAERILEQINAINGQ